MQGIASGLVLYKYFLWRLCKSPESNPAQASAMEPGFNPLKSIEPGSDLKDVEPGTTPSASVKLEAQASDGDKAFSSQYNAGTSRQDARGRTRHNKTSSFRCKLLSNPVICFLLTVVVFQMSDMVVLPLLSDILVNA
jgi:hypothetical protein